MKRAKVSQWVPHVSWDILLHHVIAYASTGDVQTYHSLVLVCKRMRKHTKDVAFIRLRHILRARLGLSDIQSEPFETYFRFVHICQNTNSRPNRLSGMVYELLHCSGGCRIFNLPKCGVILMKHNQDSTTDRILVVAKNTVRWFDDTNTWTRCLTQKNRSLRVHASLGAWSKGVNTLC